MRRRLVRVLLVGIVVATAAACAPRPALRLPALYSDGYFGGSLSTEIAPVECADVHAVLAGEAHVFVEDQPSGRTIDTARGRIEVDFCRPVGDGSDYDVPGRMAFTCCRSDAGELGDNVFSGPARVRRSGDQIDVDLDIEVGTRGYSGATGVCELGGSVAYGDPDPPPPASLAVDAAFTCRIGGPDGPPPPPSFALVTSALPEPVRGEPYLAGLEARGGTPPYRWRVTGLPSGLSSRDGAIFGTSTTPGEALVQVTVHDAAGLTRTAEVSLWTQDPDVSGPIDVVTSLEHLQPGSGSETAFSDDLQRVAVISEAAAPADPPGAPPTQDVLVWDRPTDTVRRLTDGAHVLYYDVAISGDGGTVVFRTYRALDPADTNEDLDIYLADVASGEIRRVSTDSSFSAGHVSRDGRTVFFTQATAPPGDTYPMSLFAWDRTTGVATPVADGDDWSCCLDLSDDASRVSFLSGATDLVPGDTNGHADVFVLDRPTGDITRLDTGSDDIWGASISGDGTAVAIVSDGTGLLPPGEEDTNGGGDVFHADLATGEIVRLTNGDRPTDVVPSISADGRTFAFASAATNLAAGERDTGETTDVFVWNGDSGLISRLTRSRSADSSKTVHVSADGDAVHFLSFAADLDPGGPLLTPGELYLYRWTRRP